MNKSGVRSSTFEAACHARHLELFARAGARSFGHGTGLRPVPAIPGTEHCRSPPICSARLDVVERPDHQGDAGAVGALAGLWVINNLHDLSSLRSLITFQPSNTARPIDKVKDTPY